MDLVTLLKNICIILLSESGERKSKCAVQQDEVLNCSIKLSTFEIGHSNYSFSSKASCTDQRYEQKESERNHSINFSFRDELLYI